jgi:hypothetical protein
MAPSHARRLATLLGAGLLLASPLLGQPEAAAREREAGFSLTQLRFPWQKERRPVRRAKQPRPPKPAKPGAAKQKRPAAPGRPAAAAAPQRPSVPIAPAIAGPPPDGVAWGAITPAPPASGDLPALSQPASVLVLVGAPPPPPAPPEPPRAEPASQPPLPPERPAPSEAAPSIPLPPTPPGDVRSAALMPKAPLPEPPAGPTPPDVPLPETSREDDPDCQALDREAVAVTEPAPPIEGPGVCGTEPVVTLSGVRRREGGIVEIKPAATLRCAMARAVATYVRDDLEPAAASAGSGLARLDTAGSYSCRGRNNVSGGKLSEHGRANALDIAGFALSDGRSFGVYDADMPEALAAAAKRAACVRFNTVLGPGADGHHENHLHVDLQPRRNHGKLCQWNEEDEEEAEPKAEGGK